MTAAIILAGGLGTRLRDTVPDLPKPMAAIRGRPFLAHQMDWWIAQGVDRFVLSVGYKRDCIIGHFGETYCGVPVSYAIEETPLGTGGGLLLAAAELAGRGHEAPVLVLNGDTFFEVGLEALSAFHRAKGSDWTFALFPTTDTKRYMGMDVDGDGAIRSLAPRAEGPENLANGGIYLVEPAALAAARLPPNQKISLEYELLPAVVAAGGRLHGMTCRGRFIDIGVPEDYFRAADVLP